MMSVGSSWIILAENDVVEAEAMLARSRQQSTVDAIRAALETGGVEFTNGDQPGVRLNVQQMLTWC
jgi:hypothetical protein